VIVSTQRAEQSKMKDYSEITSYEKETLSNLYASLDFMLCNDLPCSEVESAIDFIESKYSEAA